MSAAPVRRGASGRSRSKKTGARGGVSRKLASTLAVEEAEANRLAGWAFGLFVAAAAVAAMIALDIPAKAGQAAGEAVGEAGFQVKSVDIQGLKNMDPKPVYAIALGQKTTAMPLVDVSAIRERLLDFGWIKDARVSRRFPDTLVIDVVERTPAARWQDDNRLSLIDAEGVVLDRVKVSNMPDLPLLIGKGANAQAVPLERLMEKVPALKAQLESATWVGGRRWDLALQSGEVIALPEGPRVAEAALVKFAQLDKTSGLLGRGILRFDLRIPGKMIARLPQAPGAVDGEATPPQG